MWRCDVVKRLPAHLTQVEEPKKEDKQKKKELGGFAALAGFDEEDSEVRMAC